MADSDDDEDDAENGDTATTTGSPAPDTAMAGALCGGGAGAAI